VRLGSTATMSDRSPTNAESLLSLFKMVNDCAVMTVSNGFPLAKI
jgi:hypothetical protein